MRNHWTIEWMLCYDGRLHTWRQLTPAARLRIRRLVGRGKSSGQLSARDIL